MTNAQADLKARLQQSVSAIHLIGGRDKLNTGSRIYDAVQLKKRGDTQFRWLLTGDYVTA